MRIKLLIADGHPVFREAVSFWLSQREELEVLPPAADACSAVAQARRWRADVVLMDLVWPHVRGIDATRQVVGELPDVKVVVLSDAVNSQTVHGVLAAGAAGYLPKNCSSEELMHAIREVASQGSYLSPAASSVVVQDYLGAGRSAPAARKSALTPRQRQIVRRIADGYSIKRIAQEVGLSSKTVDWHKGQAMRKLGLENTASLVRYAITAGLTSDSLSPVTPA